MALRAVITWIASSWSLRKRPPPVPNSVGETLTEVVVGQGVDDGVTAGGPGLLVHRIAPTASAVGGSNAWATS